VAYPEGFVEEVRRAADIVRVISDHVSLRKMGTSWKGLCPFHREKTPSFNVRSEPAVFHCFGCGEGGDVFRFLMLHERLSFPEAVETLARRFGVPIPAGRFEAAPEFKDREELLTLLEAAARHFTDVFWSAAGRVAREYLLGRGFKKETLERIRVGAAIDSWSGLIDALRGRFKPALLTTAGLVVEKPETRHQYDRFRNRAVFPILNESGKVVAFGARSLDGSEPKYLNSPESPVYQKARTLYALSWAREGIRRESRIVLMEGYLDVARALEAGIDEAVATCGTAMTSGHARLIRRFTERVVVNFDQDEAGQKAALKGIDVLVEEALKVQVVELPVGDDPDTFVKAHGGEAYRKRLAEAPPYMEWLIRRAATAHDTATPPGKAGYLNALLPALARIDSAVERAAWVPVVVERGRLDGRATQEELRRAVAARATTLVPRPESSAPVPLRPARAALLPAERWLLGLALNGAPGVSEALAELEEAELVGLRSAPLLRAVRALLSPNGAVATSALESRLESEEDRRMLREIAVEAEASAAVDALECVKELKRVLLKARMAEIQKGLQGATGDALQALLQEKNQLGRLMAGL
jgi:DNA primase